MLLAFFLGWLVRRSLHRLEILVVCSAKQVEKPILSLFGAFFIVINVGYAAYEYHL